MAYAETQSMFLDSLVNDAAWRAKYAKKENGERIPWDLVEEDIKCGGRSGFAPPPGFPHPPIRFAYMAAMLLTVYSSAATPTVPGWRARWSLPSLF